MCRGPVKLRLPDMRETGSRVFYWTQTTDQQPFETGIQRVTRRLGQALVRSGTDVVPVGFDGRTRLIHPAASLDMSETDRAAAWLLVPEIPMTVIAEGLDPVQLARAYGLRAAAIVHDLIPIRLAHLYTSDQAALYRRYFRMFAGADLVVATTQLVAGHLRAFLDAERLSVPQIAVVPLPAQFGAHPRVDARMRPRTPVEALRLLVVSTWEPRKNLVRLLRAVQLARQRGAVPLTLTLVGRSGDYPELDAQIAALLRGLPGSAAHPRAGDVELAALYATHHASVYPSCDEGFGLPVLESLWLGRPCLCHAGSAMAEVAPGGGTLLVDMSDEATIADAMVRMAREPALCAQLTREIDERPLGNWAGYAEAVAACLACTR